MNPRLYLRLYNIYPREFHFEVSAQLEMAIVQYTQFVGTIFENRLQHSSPRDLISRLLPGCYLEFYNTLSTKGQSLLQSSIISLWADFIKPFLSKPDTASSAPPEEKLFLNLLCHNTSNCSLFQDILVQLKNNEIADRSFLAKKSSSVCGPARRFLLEASKRHSGFLWQGYMSSFLTVVTTI
jgi:hypothetical protein